MAKKTNMEQRAEAMADLALLLFDTMLEEPDRPYGDCKQEELEVNGNKCTIWVDTTKKYPVFGAYGNVSSVEVGRHKPSCFQELMDCVYNNLKI